MYLCGGEDDGFAIFNEKKNKKLGADCIPKYNRNQGCKAPSSIKESRKIS